MQRVFDVEDEKDMDLLWSILPDNVDKIEKYTDGVINPFDGFCVPSIHIPCRFLIKINWHDKTEITRPVNYEDMIGCVGWFSDNIDDKKAYLGILKAVSEDGFKYKGELHDWWFEYFTPVKKSELKFYGEQDE